MNSNIRIILLTVFLSNKMKKMSKYKAKIFKKKFKFHQIKINHLHNYKISALKILKKRNLEIRRKIIVKQFHLLKKKQFILKRIS